MGRGHGSSNQKAQSIKIIPALFFLIFCSEANRASPCITIYNAASAEERTEEESPYVGTNEQTRNQQIALDGHRGSLSLTLNLKHVYTVCRHAVA